MYPNAVVTLDLISSDVRMDSGIVMSVNRSRVVIMRTSMGVFFSSELMEEARGTRMVVNTRLQLYIGMTSLQILYRL